MTHALDFRRFPNLSLLGLGIIPGSYMAGFLIWSLHAHNEGLGVLPLNATQYLGAGAVAMGLATVMTTTSLILKHKWDAQVNLTTTEKTKTWKRFLLDIGTVAAGILTGGTLLIVVNTIIPWFNTIHPLNLLTSFSIIGIGMLIIYTSTYWLVLFMSRAKNDSSVNSLKTLLPHISGLGFSLLAFLAFFSLTLLPIMTPEFGGAQERIASLDLDPDRLSQDTLSGLWPNWEPPEDRAVIVRTPELKIAFINDNWILARSMDFADETVYDIPRSIVGTVVWK